METFLCKNTKKYWLNSFSHRIRLNINGKSFGKGRLTIALIYLSCYFSLLNMNKQYTTKEAAELVGVSDSRIRQMVLAGEIDHHYFGRALVITQKGINQAKSRIDGRSIRFQRNPIKKAA